MIAYRSATNDIGNIELDIFGYFYTIDFLFI